jgi:hypothetical protein
MVTTLGVISYLLSLKACSGDTHPPWMTPFLSIFSLLLLFLSPLSLSILASG